MLNDKQTIQLLGIEQYTDAEKEEIIAAYNIRIGEEISKDLSDEQLSEFQRIIDGDQPTIDRWLAENRPNYESDEQYQVAAEALATDNPENIGPDKMYATTAWVQENSPNLSDIIRRVTDNFDVEQVLQSL